MEEQEVLIALSAAHVTQLTGVDGKKGPWRVCANKTNEVLAELDSKYTEAQVFQILDFAKQYELIAFNVGIQFQKKLSDTHWQGIESKLNRVINELTEANDKLANKLDDFIGE